VAEQRYQAVLAVISDGLSISQVAEKFGVPRFPINWRCVASRPSSTTTCWAGGRHGARGAAAIHRVPKTTTCPETSLGSFYHVRSVWRHRSRGTRPSSGWTGIGRICAARQTIGEGDCIVKKLAVAPYCRTSLTDTRVAWRPRARRQAMRQVVAAAQAIPAPRAPCGSPPTKTKAEAERRDEHGGKSESGRERRWCSDACRMK
jgi:hypothetical protein